MKAAVLVTCTLAAAVLAVRRRYAVVTIGGPSMQPTFEGGEQVVVRRDPRGIARGSVVVAEVPRMAPGWGWERPPVKRAPAGRSWMVKRVVAVAGDPTPQRFAAAAGVPPGTQVPAGHLILAGDNASASFDSHIFGTVPEERVLGTVVRVLGRGRGAAARG